MAVDNRMKLQMFLPFLFIFLSFFAVRFIKFKPSFTPAELRLEKFETETQELKEKQQVDINLLKGPFEIVKQEDAPKSSSMSSTISAPAELKASMVVVTEKQKMAIVNGSVVREGDNIGMAKIIKIERDRILVTYNISQGNTQKTKWIYLEGVK